MLCIFFSEEKKYIYFFNNKKVKREKNPVKHSREYINYIKLYEVFHN